MPEKFLSIFILVLFIKRKIKTTEIDFVFVGLSMNIKQDTRKLRLVFVMRFIVQRRKKVVDFLLQFVQK